MAENVGVTRSPMFSHVSSTLQGLATIRAYRVEPVFKHLFDLYQVYGWQGIQTIFMNMLLLVIKYLTGYYELRCLFSNKKLIPTTVGTVQLKNHALSTSRDATPRTT